jgi:hypothetical protein
MCRVKVIRGLGGPGCPPPPCCRRRSRAGPPSPPGLACRPLPRVHRRPASPETVLEERREGRREGERERGRGREREGEGGEGGEDRPGQARRPPAPRRRSAPPRVAWPAEEELKLHKMQALEQTWATDSMWPFLMWALSCFLFSYFLPHSAHTQE